MTAIIPKLGLKDLRDSELDDYAQDKVDKLTGNSNFTGLKPTVSNVNVKNQEYRDAMAKADDGSKADTELKNQKRIELEAMLTLQAQDCARIANGDLAKYYTSGYDARDTKGTPVGELGEVTGLALDYGNNDGELQADWDTLSHARNYTWQVYTDPANPDGSMTKMDIAQKSKATLTGLPSGEKVWVRVKGNGGSTGHGPWSDPAQKRVP